MLMRQLLERRVQSLLQFGQIGFLARIASRRGLDEIPVVLDAGILVIEAHGLTAVPFFQEIDAHVHRDGVHPGVETGFSLKSLDGPVGLGKHLLQQVVGVLVVGGHVVHQAVKPGIIAPDQIIKRLWVAGLCAGNQFQIRRFRGIVHA